MFAEYVQRRQMFVLFAWFRTIPLAHQERDLHIAVLADPSCPSSASSTLLPSRGL